VCLLPILVHLKALASEGRLTSAAMVVHASLMIVGTVLFANTFI
jgi:hypothetical protein